MDGSIDTNQDAGSEDQYQNGGDAGEGGHSGHGSASALERLHTERQERRQGGDHDQATGVSGQ